MVIFYDFFRNAVSIMAVGIYSLVNRERLTDVLDTLHAVTQLPLQLLGGDGELLEAFGQSTTYCQLLKTHVFQKGECLSLHMKAARHAQTLGEAYIFACHANLNHIAFPLQTKGALLGCIIVGPFLMDTPDSTLVSGLAEKYTLTPTLSLELYDELSAVQVISPARVHQLGRLIDHLLSPLLPAEMSLLLKNQEKLYQQSRINETIQMYKEQSISPTQNFLYEKESLLLTKVRTGNIKEAKALLNDLLGYVLFSEGGKVDAVRVRAIELTTLLSRVAMDGGARTDSIYALNAQFLSAIDQNQTLDSLCLLLQDVVESFMNAMFSGEIKGNAHIREALRLMAEKYAEPLTLETVASSIGLSPNYLSALFRQVAGVSFREQLNHIRVEESKHLLLSTDYPLAQIAVAMGFVDQSYFCKVFKRVTGITPGQYRH